MIKYSIKETLRSCQYSDKKIYTTNYNEHGYEMGFGKSGHYTGHSHLLFIDILFSIDGISITNNDAIYHGNLLIVPPRTYLNTLKIGDFFFLKFCPSDNIVTLPEKTNQKLNDHKISLINDNAQLKYQWYPDPETQNFIKISYNNKALDIKFHTKNNIRISY